jgi:hypothetical protein
MSDESGTDAPGIAASDGEPVLSPAAAPKPWWLRRTRIAVAAAATAVIAASIVVAVSSLSSSQEYTTLPAPCDQIGLASLARYLPNPTGTPLSVSVTSTVKSESCAWSGTADGEVQTVLSEVVISSSPGAIGQARQFYDASRSVFDCRCAGTSVGARSVTGLGDEATAVFVTPGPDAKDLTTGSGGPDPGVTLLVLSRNANLRVTYNATAAATGMTLPADAAKLTWIVSMVRGILANLARPALIPSAPLSAPPHYADPLDPCLLITADTLARYAPGATVISNTATTATATRANPDNPQVSTCSWSSDNVSMTLSLGAYPDAAHAQNGFNEVVLIFGPTIFGQKVTGSRWLTDLGDAAAALDETISGRRGVDVIVWSGNIEFDYWYGFNPSSSPDSTTLLASGIALARDVLAALAR